MPRFPLRLAAPGACTGRRSGAEIFAPRVERQRNAAPKQGSRAEPQATNQGGMKRHSRRRHLTTDWRAGWREPPSDPDGAPTGPATHEATPRQGAAASTPNITKRANELLLHIILANFCRCPLPAPVKPFSLTVHALFSPHQHRARARGFPQGSVATASPSENEIENLISQLASHVYF